MDKKRFLATLLTVMVAIMGMQFMGVTCVQAQDATGQNAVIKIDEIVQDAYIKGEVDNLENPQDYKVLVYVHTDKWYNHPSAYQDEEGSFAAIEESGIWSISTVKREDSADKIAALVVECSVAEDAPGQLENLDAISNQAMVVYTKEEMKRNNWYGRL